MSTQAAPVAGSDPGHDLALWHRSGDRAALERVMAVALDRAYAQARRTLGHAADAQDAVQEALVQIMRSAHRYDPSRPFFPWLARHVHDACGRLRWRAGRTKARERAVARTEAPEPDRGVDGEAVRAAVAALAAADRAAIELHYWAGLSQAEAARELGVSENALAVRLHRARERLRVSLARAGAMPAGAAVGAALLAGPAWTAPPELVAGAHALSAGGVLPATTIPLGTARTLAWRAARHPWWSCAVATVLLAGLCLAAAPLAIVRPAPSPPRAEATPAPPPPAAAVGAWGGAAREALRWFDPAARVRVAADLGELRRLAATTRPLSLLADPRFRPPLLQWLATGVDDAEGEAAMDAVLGLVAEADGLAVSAAESDRVILAGPMPAPAAAGLADRIGAWLGTHARPAPAASGSPSWLIAEDGCLSFRGAVALLAPAAAVPAGPGAALASPHPQPLWLDADLRGLVAAYAAADRDRSDPIGIAGLLGPGWRNAAPRVVATVAAEGGVLTDEVRISGLWPSSPLDIAALAVAAFGGEGPPLPSAAIRLRRPDPRLVPARPAGALAWAVAGLERRDLPALAPVLARLAPGAEELLPALSGDLGLAIVPGSGMPAVTLVLGLAARPDPTRIARLAAGLGLMPADATPPALAAWRGFTPAGIAQATLLADRLVVSTAADGGLGLGGGGEVEADLLVEIDLPRIMAVWGPLLLGSVPGGGLGDPDASRWIGAHLAPWRLAWTATPDGCRIAERGLPLVGACVGAAAVRLAAGDPAAETASAREGVEAAAALARHRAGLRAAVAAADALRGRRAATAADRRALAPLCHGREPGEDEVRSLGTRYPDAPTEGAAGVEIAALQPRVVRSAGDRHLAILLCDLAASAGLRQRYRSSVAVGMLSWAMPLGDGWSLGVLVDGQAGLFRGEPPAIVPPVVSPGF